MNFNASRQAHERKTISSKAISLSLICKRGEARKHLVMEANPKAMRKLPMTSILHERHIAFSSRQRQIMKVYYMRTTLRRIKNEIGYAQLWAEIEL